MPCDFHFWGTTKNRVYTYATNPHAEGNLREIILTIISSVSAEELVYVNEASLRCELSYRMTIL